jgi:hypothetical protein
MRKIFTSPKAIRGGLGAVTAILLPAALCFGCAFTDFGSRVNAERAALEKLEKRRQKYETRHVIILNNLERNPGDPKLEKERDEVREKIVSLHSRIEAQRALFARSVQEWETKIVEERIQKDLVDKEERENAHRPEGEWRTTE